MRNRTSAAAIGLVCSSLALVTLVTLGARDAAAAPTPASLVVKVPASLAPIAILDVDAARSLLVKHAAIPSHVVLEVERRVELVGATVHRFRQVHLGVPVYGRGAGIALDARGNVILATARLEDELPADVTPAIGAAEAAALATAFSGVPATAAGATLVIVPTPDVGRLSWMVQAPAQLPELYAPLVTVDARTGRVVGAVNAVRFLHRAKVFPTNPVVDKGVTTEVTLSIPDGTNTPENADLVSYNCIDNGTVVTTTGTHGTRQTHVCDLAKSAVADPASGDFLQYDPAGDTQGGDPFAEVQIYYHANKAFEYYRSFAGNGGFKLATADQPLFVVSNWMSGGRISGDAGVPEAGSEAGVDAASLPALQPYQNAAYMPFVAGATFGQSLPALYPTKITGGVLQFGQGAAADYSYDGEVVYHEFTHAVVNATLDLVPYWHLDTQGATLSPGAMNEGLADFFSSSISGQSAVGTYAVKDLQMAGLKSIRDLANANTCPNDLSGEVHADSLFFTGALWKVRAALSTEADKKLFTATMFTVMNTIKSGDLGYEDLSQAFVTALGNTMGAAAAKAMSDEFGARGVLPRCERVIEWAGKPLRGTDPMSQYTLNVPGTADFNATLTYAPALYQVKVPLQAGQNGITATFRAASSGFGGSGATGFTPSYLVSYDAPVAFTVKGMKANTTTIVPATAPASAGDAGTAAGTLQTYTAKFDVPQGVANAYVMLVNKGQTGAYYLDHTFSITNAPGDGGLGDVDAGADAGGLGDAPTDAATSSGCGCTTGVGAPAASAATGAAAFAALALAFASRRRRR
jgi:MYXO-CTERM domain-containing protein